MISVGQCTEMALDKWDGFLEQYLRKAGTEVTHTLTFLSSERIAAVAIVHHHKHRFCLTRCNGIVHDLCHLSLLMPSTLAFTHTVLQIEHRIFCLWILFIIGRCIDIASALGLLRLGPIITLAHLSVRNVLIVGIICSLGRVLRYVDSTRHASATIIGIASRVGDLHTIHEEEIVMETYHKRVAGSCPNTISIFRHWVLLTANVEYHFLSFRCLDRELGTTV